MMWQQSTLVVCSIQVYRQCMSLCRCLTSLSWPFCTCSLPICSTVSLILNSKPDMHEIALHVKL